MDHVNEILARINAGELPNIVGFGITNDQANEIKLALDKRKSDIDNYFNVVVKSRIIH